MFRTLIAIAALLFTVPVFSQTPCPKCGQIHATVSSGVQRFVINRNPAAYQHALREAQILASRGTAGHPLGVAPGCRYSGTGYSYSQRPNHCYYGEMSESRLVARAVVRGRNGAFYWSAHYR